MRINAPLKILLAEDNSGDVFLVRRALQKHQIEFVITMIEDGEAAITYINAADSSGHQDPPDLVLLDLNLPRSSGTDVLKALKSSPSFQNAPVIVLTSSDSPRDREKALRLGAAHYFCKPTDLAGFMALGQVVARIMLNRQEDLSPAASTEN